MNLLKTAVKAGYGCWYCHGTDGEDLVFSMELDTPVHKSCALEKDNQDIESRIFTEELERS